MNKGFIIICCILGALAPCALKNRLTLSLSLSLSLSHYVLILVLNFSEVLCILASAFLGLEKFFQNFSIISHTSHSALVPPYRLIHVELLYVKLIRYQLWCTKCTFRQTTKYWQDCKEPGKNQNKWHETRPKFFSGLNVLVNCQYKLSFPHSLQLQTLKCTTPENLSVQTV
jgi:hypothetical protein